MDVLYKDPISATGPTVPRTGIITSGMARGLYFPFSPRAHAESPRAALLYSATVRPKFFPRIASAFAAAMSGNYTDIAQLSLHAVDTSSTPQVADVARSIIACLDSPPYDPDRPDTWPSVADYTDAAVARLRDVAPRFALR